MLILVMLFVASVVYAAVLAWIVLRIEDAPTQQSPGYPEQSSRPPEITRQPSETGHRGVA